MSRRSRLVFLGVPATVLVIACSTQSTQTAADASVSDARLRDTAPCTPGDPDCACTSGATYDCRRCDAGSPNNITCVDGRWPMFGCGGDACGPADVTTFVPPAYKHAKQDVGACATTEITAYFASCLDAGHTNAACDDFPIAHARCAACLSSVSTDATWGPVVVLRASST
jgi:hypothetical protein